MIFKEKGKKEDVIKRKSYYGFCVNYPGDLGSNKYVIGESRAVRKREIIRKILIAVALVVVFSAAFITTEICLNISERPASAAVSESVFTPFFLNGFLK